MKKLLDKLITRIVFVFTMFFNFACQSQRPDTGFLVKNRDFDNKLKSLLSFNVPIIGVEEVSADMSHYTLLDAREKSEYDVSHIQGAIHTGYDKFDSGILKNIPKDAAIVVYCSVGYRSEKICQKLIKLGYKNVKNLYGSIFEWTNRGLTLYDYNEKPTSKIHTYNKDWSKWVDNQKMTKVW